MALTILPTDVGSITNTAVVGSISPDQNQDDNTASVVTTVIGESADLAVSVLGSPEMLLVGQDLTYHLSVVNQGPGSATSVAMSDRLPPGVTFVSASPATYSVNGTIINFTNLGTLGKGETAQATIVVRPQVSGLLTNTVNCVSPISDPFKLNNTASVKTTVNVMQIAFGRVGNNLTLTWPADPANFILESNPTLDGSAGWTQVTSGISTINGQNVYSVPIGPGSLFFRLRASTP
jgi:uncharacterized repeat protein (TIGR01451 family)